MKTISLYIHWPFCRAKCPYCDFNSFVGGEIDKNQWLNAYKLQLEAIKPYLQGKIIDTIFFGGGTPSLAPTAVIAGILDYIFNHFKLTANPEITLEANPTSIELEKFRDFRAAGINRVSIGIQSLRPEHLKFLGREHSADDSLKALEIARNSFDNTSFDLMYCLPGQTLAEWLEDLAVATDLMDKHISLYQLTIEKGTPFYKDYMTGKLVMPPEHISAEFYEVTVDFLAVRGIERYEVSNFARPQYRSRHNMNYWNYGEYIGIGAGAHSRVNKEGRAVALTMQHNPDKWLKIAENSSLALQSEVELTVQEAHEERIMMGLRTVEGIEANLVAEGVRQELMELGLLQQKQGRLSATDRGFMVLNAIIAKCVGL